MGLFSKITDKISSVVAKPYEIGGGIVEKVSEPVFSTVGSLFSGASSAIQPGVDSGILEAGIGAFTGNPLASAASLLNRKQGDVVKSAPQPQTVFTTPNIQSGFDVKSLTIPIILIGVIILAYSFIKKRK